MKRQEICSFFISKAHLLTIILPYINEKICEGKNVKIISQIDLDDDVKKYLKSIKKFDNENIKQICWKNEKNDKDIDKNTILFYIGDENYIKNKNDKKICEEIVKCYEIEKVNNMEKIIKENQFYLKTEGKFEIKNSQNEQNSNTIKAQL